MPIHKAFRSEGDFPVFDARLKNVADLDMHLLADMLRNYNLKLVFYGDNIHGVPCPPV